MTTIPVSPWADIDAQLASGGRAPDEVAALLLDTARRAKSLNAMPLLRALPLVDTPTADAHRGDADRRPWLAFAETVESRLTEGGCAPPTLAARHLLLFACEALALGRRTAAERFAGRAPVLAATLPADVLVGMGRDWAQTLWFAGAEEELAARFAGPDPATWSGASADPALRLLDLLGFHLYAPYAWASALYRRFIVPCIGAAAEAGHAATALILEAHAYLHHCRMVEDEEHTSGFFAAISGPLTTLGRCRAPGLLAAAVQSREPPLVAFLFQFGAEAAHTEVAGNVLGALARAPVKRIRPVVYLLEGNPVLEQRFADGGVPMVVVGHPGVDPAERLDALARRARRDGVAATVTVSLPLWLAYLSGLRPSPVQVLWAHKRHPAVFPDVVGHIAAGPVSGGERSILGRRWRTVRGAFAGLAEAAEDRDAAVRARMEREGLKAPGIILGTIAREEKVNQPEFLDAVVTLLHDNPDALFLWTGRNEHPAVRAHFQRAGVAERTRFIGWVPVRVFVRVFDVYLSTFPQGGGLSEGEALAAGTPVVGMIGDNGILDANVWPVIADEAIRAPYAEACRTLFRAADGASLLPRAADGAAYRALAQRLIDDPDWRDGVGKAGRAWVLAHFSDVDRYADDLAEVLLEIIADAAAEGRTK